MENKTAEEIFFNKLVHYNPKGFPHGMKKAIYKAMEAYADQERLKGITEGFNAAREKSPTTHGIHFANIYPTLNDYLNSKSKP